MKKIPKARVGALREVEEVTSAPSEAINPQAKAIKPKNKPAKKPITPMTWVKVGLASAAAFAIAMVGITAVEFGTSQPISSLVSSTTGIDRASSAHKTTLGFLGGTRRPRIKRTSRPSRTRTREDRRWRGRRRCAHGWSLGRREQLNGN